MTQTDDALSIAESVLLAPANLHTPQLASLLNGKLTGQADYADIYFQHSRHEAWVLEDGIVRDASFNTERGAGVRIVQGDKTGFAYSDDITLAALQQASGAARAITRQGQDRQIQLASRAATARYTAIDPLLGWPRKKSHCCSVLMPWPAPWTRPLSKSPPASVQSRMW